MLLAMFQPKSYRAILLGRNLNYTYNAINIYITANTQ